MADPDLLSQLRVDLAREHEALDLLVSPLGERDLDQPTPAEGWLVRDQIAHLGYYDERAVEAIEQPNAFHAAVEALLASPDALAALDAGLSEGRAKSRTELLAWWRTARAHLLDAIEHLDPSARIWWYGPPMGAASFISARLMETWAHGQDIVDALGLERPATPRLRHIARLGVNTVAFSFGVHGQQAPTAPIRVELEGPGGERWAWGPESAPDTVRGSALDFCLIVTQRRHPADTALGVAGPAAIAWIGQAQAFAGPPGTGRGPGQFAR